jgi:hypothetical protein
MANTYPNKQTTTATTNSNTPPDSNAGPHSNPNTVSHARNRNSSLHYTI